MKRLLFCVIFCQFRKINDFLLKIICSILNDPHKDFPFFLIYKMLFHFQCVFICRVYVFMRFRFVFRMGNWFCRCSIQHKISQDNMPMHLHFINCIDNESITIFFLWRDRTLIERLTDNQSIFRKRSAAVAVLILFCILPYLRNSFLIAHWKLYLEVIYEMN